MDDFDSDWEDPASVARLQAAKVAEAAPKPEEAAAEQAPPAPPPSAPAPAPVASSPAPASGVASGPPRPGPPRPAQIATPSVPQPPPSSPMEAPTPVFSFAITPSAARTRAAVPVPMPEESSKPTQPPPAGEEILESDLLEDRTSARPPPPPPAPPPVPPRPAARSPGPPAVQPVAATSPAPPPTATSPAATMAGAEAASATPPTAPTTAASSEAPVAPVADAPPPSDAAAAEPDESQVDSAVEQFEDPREELSQRLALGDYSGALDVAEEILITAPNDAAAKAAVAQCRATLIEMYTSRIGSLDRVPQVAVAREQLRWLTIDHRAGFVLSHIDGVSNLEMIVDVSGMSMLDALRILCDLTDQKVISFR